MSAVDVSPKASRRAWLALAVLCLPTVLTTVDLNVLFLALPRISADLGAGSSAQLWIMDIYGFMIAGFLVTMGTLGDRVGRRKVLFGGAVLFIAASLTAAFADSTAVLIGARAVLGIAGATVMPTVLALIRDLFKDPKQLNAAYGIWGTSLMAGVILGPTVGGLLLGAFWWGAAFLLGVPIMAVVLLAGPAVLPDTRDPNGGRLDLASVALSLAAILPFVYGLKEITRGGAGIVSFASIVVGVAAAVTFVARQRRLADPLLDLRLFGNRALRCALILGLVIAFLMGGLGLAATGFLQMVRGLSPLSIGLWLLAPSLAMIVAGNLAPAIATRVRPAYVLAAGLLLGAVGNLLLTRVGAAGGMALLIAATFVIYIGGSPVGIMSNSIVMMSTPPERAGAAGALSSTSGEFGVALGVAVLGALGTSVYRGQVEVPAGVDGAAHESIAGALSVAGQLPGPAGAALLDSAREAFTGGMHVIAFLSAAVFVGLAVLVLVALRHLPPTGAAATGVPAETDAAAPVLEPVG
jgi:DHA2 family multidrug resistance protein-like MFS transporter